MKGPSLLSVSTKSAFITAASKADSASVAITKSTKSCGGFSAFKTSCGSNTLLIMCTIPFEFGTSAPTTLASSSVASPINTPPSRLIETLSP